MKSYTPTDPEFHETLTITEVTDPAHADNVNKAPMEAFDNTLVLKEKSDSSDVSISSLMQMLTTGVLSGALVTDDGAILTDDDGAWLFGDWRFKIA